MKYVMYRETLLQCATADLLTWLPQPRIKHYENRVEMALLSSRNSQ